MAEDQHAAFLAQLGVLQAAIQDAERASPSAPPAPTSSQPSEGASRAPPAPSSSQLRESASMPALPESEEAADDGELPLRHVTSVPAESVSAGAGGSVLFRRGISGVSTGVSTVVGFGRKTASNAIGLGVGTALSAVILAAPVVHSAAHIVSKTIEGRKEAAMDAALRLALERGLRNAGHRFVELLADDEDMPDCARARMRAGGEWMWAEVETEVMAAVLLENTFAARRARALELERYEAETRELRCCPNPLARARAAVLYALYPYDKSLWGQLRMPTFYPLMLLQLCPLWGIQPLFFLTLFLLRDKTDEFQLCQFILEFKGLQFLTVGAIAGLMGGAQAQWCSTHGTCSRMGLGGAPGMHATFNLEMGCFVLNVLLVWAAFVLLPLSRQKGALGAALDLETGAAPSARSSHEPVEPVRSLPGRLGRGFRKLGTLLEPAPLANMAEEPAQRCCCGCLAFNPKRGGALRSLLVYDLLSFLTATWLGALACATSSGWQLRSWLFWCRVLYGLCSFPFLLFMCPPLDRVLLHAKPTAYDRQGRCVAPLSLRDRQLRHEIHASRAKARAAGKEAATDRETSGSVAPSSQSRVSAPETPKLSGGEAAMPTGRTAVLPLSDGLHLH